MSRKENIVTSFLTSTLTGFGAYILFTASIFRCMVYPRLQWRLLLQQLEFVGNKSLSTILLASVMIGAVFGIEFGKIFKLFGTESMLGAAAAFSLSKELAPVVGAFLVTGRAGSSMAAEIATMRVNEQIDAMRVMAVNPIAYLCAPRVLASILMMPLLAGVFVICGIVSSYCFGRLFFEIDPGVFVDKITWISRPAHLIEGLEKAMLFGALFSSIACFTGFHAKGGAKGVGKATTHSVVMALVSILILDFFVSYLKMEKLQL